MAKIGFSEEFVSEVLGTAAGTAISKSVDAGVLTDELKRRHGQLMTLLFGPGDVDEQLFCNAVFNCMRTLGPAEYEHRITKLFTRLEKLPSDLQDAFRNKILQMTKIVTKVPLSKKKQQTKKESDQQEEAKFKETEEVQPNADATALVLIGIADLSQKNWDRFVKIMNLTREDAGFNIKSKIEEVKAKRTALGKEPRLTFWQRFNFFRMY